MVRLETLRVFVTVAESGTLREAAAILARTQSALSMALKQLEDDLGGPLFETDRKRELTDLGQFVRDVAQGMLRDHDHGMDLIARYAGGRSGRLRLVSVPSVAALVLPEVLRDFMRDHEGAEIDLMDTDSSNVRKMLVSGLAELGIASPPPPGAEGGALAAETLFHDRLHLVCRAGSALAEAGEPLGWEALEGVRLIMNETLRGLESPEFGRLAAESRLSVRNILSLLAMVQAGTGVTILPGLATVTLPPALVARRLADPACVRTVSLLSRVGRAPSPLATAFARHMRAVLPEIARRHGLSLDPAAR